MVWAFARYFRGTLSRAFTSVRWTSMDDRGQWDHAVPTMFVSNHTSWWDGFLSYMLTQELGLTFHILMEAVNLDRYPVFKRIGALPMRRDSRLGAYDDLEAAARALRPGVGFWVYPQGQRRPAGENIARLERGAAHLAVRHQGPLRICPVAFRYPFMSEQLPEAVALMGDPWMHDGTTDRKELTVRMGDAMGETVAMLDARLAREDLSGFRTLVKGRLSINKRMDRVRHSLGILVGDFEERNG